MKTLIALLFAFFISAPITKAQLAVVANSLEPNKGYFNSNKKQRTFSAVFTEADMRLMKNPEDGTLIYCSDCEEEVGFYLYIEESWRIIGNKSIARGNCRDQSIKEDKKKSSLIRL